MTSWKDRTAIVALAELPLIGLATIIVHKAGFDWPPAVGIALLLVWALNLVADVRAWDRRERLRHQTVDAIKADATRVALARARLIAAGGSPETIDERLKAMRGGR
jgi:hypothetical protein